MKNVLHKNQEMDIKLRKLLNLTDLLRWYYEPWKFRNLFISRQKSAAPRNSWKPRYILPSNISLMYPPKNTVVEKKWRFQVSVDRWIFIVIKRPSYQKVSPWPDFFGHMLNRIDAPLQPMEQKPIWRSDRKPRFCRVKWFSSSGVASNVPVTPKRFPYGRLIRYAFFGEKQNFQPILLEKNLHFVIVKNFAWKKFRSTKPEE